MADSGTRLSPDAPCQHRGEHTRCTYGRCHRKAGLLSLNASHAGISTKHPGCSEGSWGRKPSHAEALDKRDLLDDYLTAALCLLSPLLFCCNVSALSSSLGVMSAARHTKAERVLGSATVMFIRYHQKRAPLFTKAFIKYNVIKL